MYTTVNPNFTLYVGFKGVRYVFVMTVYEILQEGFIRRLKPGDMSLVGPSCFDKWFSSALAASVCVV